MPADAPTANNAGSSSLLGLPMGDDASEAAPAPVSALVPPYSKSVEEGVAVMSLSPCQPRRAQSQATTSLPASDYASTEVHVISGKPHLLLP